MELDAGTSSGRNCRSALTQDFLSTGGNNVCLNSIHILFFLKILYMRFTVKPRFLIQIVMNFGVMAADRPYITQILLTMPL